MSQAMPLDLLVHLYITGRLGLKKTVFLRGRVR